MIGIFTVTFLSNFIHASKLLSFMNMFYIRLNPFTAISDLLNIGKQSICRLEYHKL